VLDFTRNLGMPGSAAGSPGFSVVVTIVPKETSWTKSTPKDENML
jgi:hypothetical protein